MSLKVHVNVYDKCFNSYQSICVYILYIYNVIAYKKYIHIYIYIIMVYSICVVPTVMHFCSIYIYILYIYIYIYI